jgi:hypothetical protein
MGETNANTATLDWALGRSKKYAEAVMLQLTWAVHLSIFARAFSLKVLCTLQSDGILFRLSTLATRVGSRVMQV